MATLPKVDVVTVGAGWTAGILAQQLTYAGYDVVSIEAGPARWTDPDFLHNHDYLRFNTRTAMMFNLSQETWTWRPNPRLPSLPMRQFGAFHPGLGVGGAGIHWAAQTWRFYPTDYRYRTHHVERYGQSRIPEGAQIQDWGITYEELEPYYTQMEYDIGISGQAGNLNGVVQEGGNPFEGPRSQPYPLPPLVKSIGAEMFTSASESLGYHPFPQPAAILSQAYKDLSGRQRSGCLYCGYCTRFGCEVDAKASPNVSHIPMALASGRYEIRTNCKAIKVNVSGDGLATGITYIDQAAREEHFQPAEVVILSAYTLSNVRLLLLSRDDPHPNGIGNDRGLVGKNYTYQLGGSGATGIFEGRRFNSYMGNSCVQAAIHDFNADNFDHANLDFIGGASLTCGGGEKDPVGSAIRQPVAPQPSVGGQQTGEEAKPDALFPGLPQESGSLTGQGRQWGREWKENLRRNWDCVLGIGVQGESLPYPDQFLDLDPMYKDAHGLPLLRVTFDWHENDYRLFRFVAQRSKQIMEAMNPTHLVFSGELEPHNIHSYQSTHSTGGAIMGVDPGISVTNKYGQVWDTPNVFVTGAALYPQNPGMNPTGHLLAHTYYVAAALKTRYFRDPGELLM